MKKAIIMGLLIMFSACLFGQKRIVLKPEKSGFETSLLSGRSLVISFQDKRIIERKAKVNATFDDVTKAVTETLVGAGATVTEGEGIQIAILQYEAFAKGVVWIAVTKYEVTVGGEKHTIQSDHSEGNVWGSRTAKIVLQKSFDKANEELITFLSEHAR
jgi:hypothetical protein